jgi:hypothetical protein
MRFFIPAMSFCSIDDLRSLIADSIAARSAAPSLSHESRSVYSPT